MQYRTRCVIAGFATAIVLGACAISQADEVAMGAEYAEQVNAELPMVTDPAVVRYFSVLGDSLARLADDRGLTWRFYLVDTKEVNAFAIPGGWIYVTRGLIERMTEMDQLAGVLGHEIAHVTRRHSVEQMERIQRANLGVSLACILTGVCESGAAQAAIQIGGTAVIASYSRDDEREADEDAVKFVVRAGIHPNGMLEVLDTLLAERKRSPGALDAWFSTHPTEEQRIATVQGLIARVDSAILLTLTEDSPRFHEFHARLMALPAARASR